MATRPPPQPRARKVRASGRAYWLMKTEPDAFSIEDLERKKTSGWDGVRNFQARNNMDAMRRGDLVLFYHSSCDPPGVVGIAKVCRESHPDPTQFDPKSQYFDARSDPEAPRWRMVEVEFVARLPRMVTLEELKAESALRQMPVVSRARLSVQPVNARQFQHVLEMAGAPMPK